MKSENFVVIQGWMCNELDLKGTELLVFALIHGFSQDNVSKFNGGRKYIADTFNISLPTVDKALQSLVDKEYILKQESNDFTNPNIYWVNFDVVKKLYEGSKETLLGGSKETLLNNTSKQTDRKKERVSKDTTEFQFGNQKPKKENLYSKCVSLIDLKTGDLKIRQLLIDWLNMLLEKYRNTGRVLYANVFKGKLNMLDKFDERDWRSIIEFSIQRGYEGFYPVTGTSSDIKNKPWEQGVTCEAYTKEELEAEQKDIQARLKRGERVYF